MTTIQKILCIAITIMIPFFLIMTGIRILLTPIFLQVEYQSPGFPDDPFGFTMQDRLHWSKYALDYLLNNEGISYLENLKFPDGNPLYNERELSHMFDVKNLVQAVLKVWYGMIVVLLGSVLWAYKGKWKTPFWIAIKRGGFITTGIIIAILIFVAASFTEIFTLFHRLFFEGDTWLFQWSDTLIRLFPMQFWQNAFILLGVSSLVGGLGLVFLSKRMAK